ncbi:hypothetical protein BH10PSE4_BH10PSE4_39520 [soil metagenome]
MVGMTQMQTPTWAVTFQLKLMAALDAAWAMLEDAEDPAEIRKIRDRAKAIGDLAAMARKVAAIIPAVRPKPRDTLLDAFAAMAPAVGPVAAQAEPARRALDKLKGSRRGRL